MKKTLALIILILLLPQTVSAQGIINFSKKWYELLNIPEDFSTFPNIIYLVAIPFLAVFAIIFGVLSRIFGNLFNKRIRTVIAFVFAASLLYLGPITMTVSVLLQVGSVFAVVVFFIMFFVLITFFLFRKTTSSYAKAKEIYSKVQSFDKSRKDITDDITKLVKEIDKLTKRKDDTNKKIGGEQETISGMSDKLRQGQHWRDWDRDMRKHQALLDDYNREYRNIQEDINKLRERIDDLRKKEQEMKLGI